MVPKNSVPLDKWSLEYSVCSRGNLWWFWSMGTKLVGDHLSRGTKFLGTICPLGPNLMGTVCPGGPNCLGTICPWGPNFWGPFVYGDRKWGTGSLGIKWVRDQMSCSRSTWVIQMFFHSLFYVLSCNIYRNILMLFKYISYELYI